MLAAQIVTYSLIHKPQQQKEYWCPEISLHSRKGDASAGCGKQTPAIYKWSSETNSLKVADTDEKDFTALSGCTWLNANQVVLIENF